MSEWNLNRCLIAEAEARTLKNKLAIVEGERDNNYRHVGLLQELLKEAEACKAILRDERDTAQLNANAMRGNEAANVALVDKYFHENLELQRERDEAREEAAAMRRERDEWKARWEKDVTQSIAWIDQDRLRRAEIYAAQNREERDRARQERDEALKLLDQLWQKIGKFRGRDV